MARMASWAVLTGLGLAACAAPPPRGPELDWLEQSWTVTDAWAVREPAGSASPVGQRLFLGRHGNMSPDGRTCPNATVDVSEQTLAVVLGGDVPEGSLARTVPKIAFQCDGKGFMAYGRLGPDRLMTRSGGWLVTLQPSAGMAPVPFAAPPPMAPAITHYLPPPPLAVVPVQPPPAAPPPDLRLVYLASYARTEQALKGFQEIQPKSPALQQATPRFTTVDIPGRGHYVRLFAEVEGADKAERVCTDLRQIMPDSCATDR